MEKQPGHLIDILATCVDVAGAEYPKEFKGKPITPREGTSLLPAFTGQNLNRSQPIFWEHEGNRAIREGDLKLVALENQPWRLYDLAADRSEQNDLAASRPDAVKSLSEKWQAWAARSNVLPLGAWRGDGPKKAANKQTRFDLKTGDHLEGNTAPAVANRGFTITAKFEATPNDGVILAHGGTAHGYSFSIHEGKLTFLIRSGGNVSQVTLPEALSGPQTAVARFTAAGILTLSSGDKQASASSDGPIKSNPKDGLDVGNDAGAPVGPYAAGKRFEGKIESVSLVLDEN